MKSLFWNINSITRVNNAPICLFILNFSLCFNALHSINSFDFELNRYKREASNCTATQFRCKNNDQCINESSVCDGVKDCADSSDENMKQCLHVYCPSYSFKCAYGACIDATAKCDGKPDCADESDESSTVCSYYTSQKENVCEENKFQCISKQCIDVDLLCDGQENCEDGSDETYHHCRKIRCDESLFRCDYGACINKNHRCDGIKHCADGSDESARLCNTTYDHSIDHKITPHPEISDANDFCVAPLQSLDKTVKYKCHKGNTKSCNVSDDGVVRQFTIATFECKSGYLREEGNQFQSICLEKEWQPPISTCNRLCHKLTPVNVDLKCYHNGSSISCDGNLFSGTVVRPTCKILHTYKDFVPTFDEIACKEDGTWDNTLFACTPGISNNYFVYINIIILYMLFLALFFYFRKRILITNNMKI